MAVSGTGQAAVPDGQGRDSGGHGDHHRDELDPGADERTRVAGGQADLISPRSARTDPATSGSAIQIEAATSSCSQPVPVIWCV